MINPSKVKYIVVAIVVALAAFIFYDWVVEWIAELIMAVLAFFGVATANEKRKEINKYIADEHEDMADERLAESVKELEKAKEAHSSAHEAADVTEPNYNNLPPGFKPKKISSR